MPPAANPRLYIARADLRRAHLAADPDAPGARSLDPGQARLRIEQFALSANNVTYAGLGESMKYWQFFPSGDATLGCLPVWGFATVIESLAEGVAVGRRVWGFFPAGTHLVVQPARVTPAGFSDAAAHRQGLAAVYNRYVFCDADPAWQPTLEGLQAVLRPLFTTAFLVDDFLADNAFFGARQVLLSSASSKTAIATAFCLAQRRGTPGAPSVVGLTSPANADFTRSLGCYDSVLLYDEVTTLAPDVPSVYIDFAGSAAVRRGIHERLGTSLRHSSIVGSTHAAAPGPDDALPGPAPTVFMGATQAARRAGPPPQGWGGAGLEQRVAQARRAFFERVSTATPPWMNIVAAQGGDALLNAWDALLQGKADARAGLIFALGETDQAAQEPEPDPDPAFESRRVRSAPATDFITKAPRDVDAWATLFTPESLPVLARTADALDELRVNEDAVDAHLLTEVITADPLMTLKVLAHLARLRRGREGSDTETVTAALVMLGIPPFFHAFETLHTVEDRLAERPAARAGFAAVLRRARRAARFAIGFAVHRMDHDAAVIYEAALLHDFAELLLWLRAPDLAAEIARRQQADSTLRSAAVQRELLNIHLVDLEHALMKAWRLPTLLMDFTDEHAKTVGPQMRNVQLAIRVARHSTQGWDNAALPDDIRDLCELLNLTPEPTTRLLHEIDADPI
jgi:HD-like signal output (HDOD) protein